jgi:hypothetical protein
MEKKEGGGPVFLERRLLFGDWGARMEAKEMKERVLL